MSTSTVGPSPYVPTSVPTSAATGSRTVRPPLTRTVGVPERPRWVLPALLVLLAGTAALYLIGLTASGYANEFYAAAVEAGTKSWQALLFGSLDPGGAITVDKPPAAFWVMALSGRIFGFSPLSLLAPQALEGVLAVWLLFSAVRRWSGPVAGLLAGAALALTPVAALMFRFDNPDALMTLLVVAGGYCVVRAVDKASPWWLALAGVAIGFGFLAKMMQAFLVLPAFALVYVIVAPTSLGRRCAHLLAAGGALVCSAGWYVALVALWPASSRPYIGGSTDNSLLDLAIGYNGIGRVLGGDGNRGGAGGGGARAAEAFGGGSPFGGSTGLTRLFGSSMGTEISWLLPAALIALLGGLWFTRRAPRTDRVRAGLVLWGGWLLVGGLVLSYMQGTTHSYYTITVAPAIAALVAVGGWELWRGRAYLPSRVVLGAMVAVTGVWDYVLLDRTPTWLPPLRYLVLVAGLAVAVLIVIGPKIFTRALAVATVVTVLTGPAAYAVVTAATSHNGGGPASGPAGYRPGMGLPGGGPGGQLGAGAAGDNALADLFAGATGGLPGGFGGGFGGGGQANNQLDALLAASTTTWAAATEGSSSAASLELASGASVLAIGGFTGSDPYPTLAQFQAYVRDGKIHYFIGGNGMAMGGRAGRGPASEIASWVTSHFSPITVGGQTVYDLTKSSP